MPFADRVKALPVVLEVVPPHRRASESTVRKFVSRVQRAVATLPDLAAVNLPEVLDENFAGEPFYRHMSPRHCARLVDHRLGVDVLVNKVVVHLKGLEGLDAWIRESLDVFGLRSFTFVGGSSPYVKYPGPTVAEADRRLRELTRDLPGVALGNIAIPERPGEVERLVEKTRAGAQFFTTQVLFEPGPVLSLLRGYGAACAAQGLEPATVLLSFAPVTDFHDVEFLAWLGASISARTEDRLLAASTEPGAPSLEVARGVWTTVRDGVAASEHPVPLGANVEEVSAHNFELAVRMAKEIQGWRSD